MVETNGFQQVARSVVYFYLHELQQVASSRKVRIFALETLFLIVDNPKKSVFKGA